MKSDLDALMAQKKLDALLVFGNAENNPPMTYLTGGGHVSAATLIKKRGEKAVLFCNDMERDEAAKSGLTVRLYSEYPWSEMLKITGGDSALTSAMRLQRMFEDLGVNGQVGLYGFSDLSSLFAMLAHFQRLMPTVKLIGETRDNSIFMLAMETKSPDEVARIRRMGKITTEVVGLTAAYLQGRDVRGDQVLLKEDGSPLTIGDLKEKINLWLAERGATPSEGYILAIGKDAGVPHSQGNPLDEVKLGQTIVFDIYPQENGGGYFYDFTRTWSLGYATPEAQQLYDQVKNAYERVVENLDMNAKFKDYQSLTCDIFEKDGHPTPRSQKAPLQGYVHSLGHGLGLNIHERPWSGLAADDDNLLKPGVVFTIEPGLYYPERGMGFRIEDSYWMNPEGKIELLAEYPYDFVLEMKKWEK
ncbi:MAG: M24 family metallopeptidase [Anaerolineales bacterium]|jgi:Xaa-Pro aminopeptidase|nr:M24 family metallopeptidase [Anaerolineales bacterium]